MCPEAMDQPQARIYDGKVDVIVGSRPGAQSVHSAITEVREVASVTRPILIGQLAADPELRFLRNGDAVASVTVAHSRRKVRQGQGRGVESRWASCCSPGRCGGHRRTVNTLSKRGSWSSSECLGSVSWENDGARSATPPRWTRGGSAPASLCRGQAGQEPEAGRERRHTTPCCGYGKSASTRGMVPAPAGAAERRTPVLMTACRSTTRAQVSRIGLGAGS